MNTLLRLCVVAGVTTSAAIAGAQNLLTGGAFEPVGGSVPGWTLDEFVTGSGNDIDSAQIVGFDPIEGSNDLWNRPFVGGEAPGPDNLTNSVLFQEVPVTAGQTYTFSGQSRWEDNYSGGVTTLNAASPLGAVASPTQTNMIIEFLDSGGSVVGTPEVLDLSTEQGNFNFWIEHTLSSTAPGTAVMARVTAEARDMVWNGVGAGMGALQSAFYDDFSFTDDADPGTELLMNPGLEDSPPSALDNFVVFQNDPENPANDEIVRTAGFANNTPGGVDGMWLSSFFGEIATPVDGSVSQTVAGTPGEDYIFSAFSNFEANYSGGDPGQPTQTFMELAFLDGSENVIGSPVTLDVRVDRDSQSGGNANDNVWYEHMVSATAPAGTASVRVTAGMEDGISTSGAQSAFFDDLSLVIDGGGLAADADSDGDVDVADALALQRLGADLSTDWANEFGAGSVPVSAASAVPEPSTALGVLLAAGIGAFRRRRTC